MAADTRFFLNVPNAALTRVDKKDGVLVALDDLATNEAPFRFVPVEIVRKGGSHVLVSYAPADAPSGQTIDVSVVALKPKNAARANDRWRRTGERT
eukprot:2667715-Prymnesium_polylepis.1